MQPVSWFILQGELMKTAKLMLATTALPLVLALAACSHNSDTAGGPGSPALTPGKTIAQSTSDTASNLLSGDGDTAGATLETTAVTSSAYQTTFADGTEENPNTGQAIAPPTFSIKKNGSGAVDMTVNGQTVSFAASGLVDNEGWEKYTDPDNTYEGSLWTHSANTASEAIDGTDTNYLQVWNYDARRTASRFRAMQL
ncbi:hypothetical protein ASD64_12730 [Mesorhizobium sp. Root157]|nr:hypothetical protein ASD64_12730 [Mesorhizobium sp. Root157]